MTDTRNRIKGVALSLEIGSPGVEYKCDVTGAKITNEEGEDDTITFCDVESGDTRDFFLNIAGVQSTDPDSLWSLIWDHAGDVVPFTYAPHGNETPTAAQPHFTGMVKIGPEPELGGDAGRGNTYKFESVWEIEGKPVKDTGE